MEIKDITAHVANVLPHTGVNKQRELVRLIFEINKRGGGTPQTILPFEEKLTFDKAKKILIAKRYPKNGAKMPLNSIYLPKLDLDAYAKADLSGSAFYPKNIYVDAEVKNSGLAKRVKQMFPNADYEVLEQKKQVGSREYSKRLETLYIIREKYDFLKPCPCTRGAYGCGYNLVNLGFGCVYECAYCFLQEYQNLHAVILPANIGDFLNRIAVSNPRKGPFNKPRIGSGEFTDSLVFDHITGYSKEIIEFFKTRPDLDFEFKTKSVNIGGLLAAGGAENIVVAWSVNAQNIIKNTEFLTPSLDERLEASLKVVNAGFRTAFHFDPVILHDGWKENYKKTIDKIAAKIPLGKIAWISVGTLRFNRDLKKIAEARHPGVSMLDEEFFLAFDGKMRYSESDRKEVYDFIIPILKERFSESKVYLCMENVL